MHGSIEGQVPEDHKGRSYKIKVLKTEHLITKIKRHIKAIPVLVEDYLRLKISKANGLQADDKLNKDIDCFALLNQHEHLKNFKMTAKDIMSKTTQLQKHTRTDQPGDINQSNNRLKDGQELNKQTHT